jgi:hypothetical protein
MGHCKPTNDVSEYHTLDSHPVDPCRTPLLTLHSPSPAPSTVTLLCFVDMRFRTDAADTTAPWYDTVSLQNPVVLPNVSVIRTLPPVPTALLHDNDVSDTNALASHPVNPTRALGLAPSVQKLSPITLIIVADEPQMFALSPSPPPSCSSLRCPSSLPSSRSPSPQPAPLTTALSYDIAMLLLITFDP